MSVIEVKPTDEVIAVAEGGIPVTGKMIEEWCAAYDKGELPDGYSLDSRPVGRPRLASSEETANVSFKCPESSVALIERAAEACGKRKSAFIRDAAIEKAMSVVERRAG